MIEQTVDDALTTSERDNPALTDVFPKAYARLALDKRGWAGWLTW